MVQSSNLIFIFWGYRIQLNFCQPKYALKSDNKINILYFCIAVVKMKFLLSATLALVVNAQHEIMSRNFRPSPIVETTEETAKIQGQEQSIQPQVVTDPPIFGAVEFNPFQFTPEEQTTQNQDRQIPDLIEIIEQAQNIPLPAPMPGSEEFNPLIPPPGPMPGSEEFNPIQFRPQDQKHSKKHKKHGKKGDKPPKKHENSQKIGVQNGPFSYEEEQKHIDEGHRRGKYHKKLWIPILSVALVFTFIGILLAKCIFKIRKCGMRKCRNSQNACGNRSLNQIHDEIKQKEQHINELKGEYQKMREIEERNAELRNQQAAYRAHQMELIQRIQPQRMQRVPQVQHYQPNQIPIGRPVNYYQAQ